MLSHTSRLSAIVFFLLSLATGYAQTVELELLQVEVKPSAGSLQYGLELYDLRTHQKVAAPELCADGSFALRHVPYGDYQLALVDPTGNVVHQRFITVNGTTRVISIDVSLPPAARLPGGPVSVQQLQHPPSKKAFQAMKSAQKFSETGDFEKAAKKLREAVVLSPYYAEAHTNLGVQYIRLGRYDDAQAELLRALEIGGANPLVLTDLAGARLALRKYTDAAQTAMRALQLEPGYAPAHYILGIALSTNNSTVLDGLLHLRQASESMPEARAEIERIRKAFAVR